MVTKIVLRPNHIQVTSYSQWQTWQYVPDDFT